MHTLATHARRGTKEEGIHKVYTGDFSSSSVSGIIGVQAGSWGLLQPPSIFKWPFSGKRTSNIRTKPLDFRAIIGEIIRVRDLSLQTKLVPYTNEWYCIGKLPHNYLKFVILPKTYSLNRKKWICSLFKEWILEKSEIRVKLEWIWSEYLCYFHFISFHFISFHLFTP